MRAKVWLLALVGVWAGGGGLAKEGGGAPAQPQYVWPTDASRNLTSAFGEYRARRYHAGVDVKTWGKVGYRVFAVRPGYVWRISVSPYGYGKALYLKLDTGEIAVYAHLSRFARRIERFVEAEQKRLGRYRINLYLKPGQIPVAQGEVVAYTGQTGIGAPHLHFEIRTADNRPLNPLSKGYILPDRIKPIVTKVSFSPLDADSEVNGDYRPLILRPKWVRPGEYRIEQPVSVWGNVGLAVSAYDKDSNSTNGFGVYALRLYVDDALRFQYRFDELSFKENKMVELERDYRLSRRRYGHFHKLYKDRHNARNHYRPNRTWAGVLTSAPLEAHPDLVTGSGTSSGTRRASRGALLPGRHEFRIEITDYFGNTSTVTGPLQVGAAFHFTPVFNDEGDHLAVTNLITYDLTRVTELEARYYQRNQWRPLPVQPLDTTQTTSEKGGKGEVPDVLADPNLFFLRKPGVVPFILKLRARDQFGTPSYPYFYLDVGPTPVSNAPDVEIRYDFYDDYLRLEVHSQHLLPEVPELTLYPGRSDSLPVHLHQVELKTFVGRVPLRRLRGSYHLLRLQTRNLSGEAFSVWENFTAHRIAPPKSSRLAADDGLFWVEFWRGSLYQPLYGRIQIDSLSYAADPRFASSVYDVEPKDVLLNTGARVHFRYFEEETAPEKLGVYYKTRRKWAFIDNALDPNARTISAKVFSLEKFALLRDETPPEITRIRPLHQARLTTRTPLISVNVRDRLSGIASENDIVLRLDGVKLIAEYDPERRRVFYQVKEPLARGRHEITVWAQDRCKNDAFASSIFWVE